MLYQLSYVGARGQWMLAALRSDARPARASPSQSPERAGDCMGTVPLSSPVRARASALRFVALSLACLVVLGIAVDARVGALLADDERLDRATTSTAAAEHAEHTAAMRADARRLTAGGLVLCWVLLVGGAWAASRALREHAARSAEQALRDELTGLGNRRGFERDLDATPAPLGVVLLDLDGFKAVNTAHGLARGDEMLCDAATRMGGALRPGERLARIGGDEFARLVPGAGPEGTRAAAARLARALAAPDRAGRGLSVSAGFAAAPADADTARALVPLASAALAQVKRTGGGRLRRFDLDDAVAARTLEEQRTEIEGLLADPSRLTIVTQPVIAVTDGRIRGHEALARFAMEPPRGPDAVFAQARRVGLGAQLEAAAIAAALALPGRPTDTVLAVNLSPNAIASPEVHAVLPEDLRGVIVEVTEHELATEVEGLEAALATLRARGASIAVDDAGAGYAGLTQTVALAPDAIKLDRALVAGIDADPAKAALVEAFVTFAKRTGARLCAEGVETLGELATLARLDVDRAQGYAIARPAPGFPGVSAESVATCRAVAEEVLDVAGGPRGALRRSVHELAELGSSLARAHDLDEVAALTGALAAGLRVDELVLSRVDPAMQTAVSLGRGGSPALAGTFALADFPATALALREERALQVVLDDPDADPVEVALLARSPHAAALLVPIVWRRRPVGLLELYLREARAFTRSEISRARILAFHLGPVLAALEPAGTAPPVLEAA